MKSVLRLVLGTLMLVGILAGATSPTIQSLTGEGSGPMPTCYPADPDCKPMPGQPAAH